MKTPAEICESISIDLKARKITHKEVAEMIGKSKAVVSTQISGKKRFSKEMAALFCRALGYNINYLLFGEGELRDDSVVRDIVKIPATENKVVDTSILAGLIQIAEDLLLMNGDENALGAWREINRGNYIGYRAQIEALVKKHGTAMCGSPILARYVSEQIKSELYLLVRPTEND